MPVEVEGLIGLFPVLSDSCLLLQLKPWGARRASHHSALMGYCHSIIIVLTTQWMKEMRTWGRSGIIVFSFGVNQDHCFGLKLET